MAGARGRSTLAGLHPLGREETTMTDHPHQKHHDEDLGDMVEDFSFGMMLFAGAAIAAMIVLLIVIL